MLNQLRCHTMLNGKKLGLTHPFRSDFKIVSTVIKQSTYCHQQEQRNKFREHLNSSLSELNVGEDSMVDFYPIVGSINKSSETPSKRVFFYIVDDADQMLNDHQSSYVRVRQDHLERLGLRPNQRIELSFNDYLKWSANNSKITNPEPKSKKSSAKSIKPSAFEFDVPNENKD
jgi:hypothetical protein